MQISCGISTSTMTGQERVSNYVKLRIALGNDTDYLKVMICKFLELTPAYYQEILDAYSDKDFPGLTRAAHKLKSSIGLIGSDLAVYNIKQIHLLASGGNDDPELERLVEDFRMWYLRLCDELRDPMNCADGE